MAIFYTSYPNTQPATSLTQYVVGDWWVNLSLRYAYKLSLNGAGFKSWVRTTTAPLPNINVIPAIVASTTTNNTTATIGQAISFDAVTAYGGATTATSYTAAGTVTGYNVNVSPELPAGLSVTKVLSVITGTDSNGNATLYNNIVVKITGTPTGTATLPTSYTVTLTDASGLSGSASFTLAVQSSGVTALSTTLAVPSSTFTQGSSVSVTPVTATGGTTPLTFSISPSLSGSGLTLTSSNGAITGTANTILSTNYTITVTDSSSVPQSNSRTYSLTVNGIPLNSFVDAPTTVLTNKIAFTSFRPVRATGGFGTLTYAITPALPAGLSFNTSTGFITGTATEASPQTQYSVTVSDSSTPKQTTTSTFNLTVNELQPVTAIIAQSTLSLTINTPVSTAPVQGGATIPIQGGGGFGTLTYSISPALGVAGLTFDTSTGIISGTPTATKTLTTYTVTVTDQATTPQTANAQFSLSVAAATLATTVDISPLSLFKGVPTSLTSAIGYRPVSAKDGTGTYSYALTGNTLPTGLSFSTSTGIITGTANTLMVSPGNTFTVTVTDQTTPVNQTSSKDFVLIVSNPPALVLTNNETGTRSITRGVSTSFTPATASGGYGTYTYSISPSLPASLVLNTNTGTISGTAANSNTSTTTYTVTVTDQASQTQNTTFDLVINTPAYIKLSTTPTQNVTKGVPVISFAPLLVSGGDPGYTYSVSTGTIPAGLSLNSSTGYLSGTPTIVAANTFTITATDQASQNLTQNCTVTVSEPAALTTTLNQSNTRSLIVNSTRTAFTPVTASGGYGTISFAIAPTLPSGLTFLAANGHIFGTASSLRANSSYRVTVSDTVSPPQTSFKDFFLEVINAPLVATTNIANRSIVKNTVITPFIPVTASGGTPPYAYSATLPTGLTINTLTGAISGNSSITQSSTATTVNVSDVAGATTSNTFNLTITEPDALTANTSAANATFGVAYNRQIVVPSGGFGNYTYSFTNGTLTGTGLALNANTGFISGTPTALKANSSYTIQVSDTSGQTANGTFNFSILPPALTSTVSSSSITIQQYRSVTPFIPVKGNGGFGTLTYQITNGSLPAGLSFNTSTGQITGTPSATDSVSLTITITDEALTPQTTTGTFTLNVSAAAAAVLQAILGQSSYSFTVGENVSFTPVTGSGGYPGNSYQYAITGTLPTGLSFNTSTGNISGTFTEAFTSTSFTVTVNDEVPQYVSKSFTLEATVALVSAVDLLARNKSQSSFDQANAAFIKANSAYGSQNTTGNYANSAYNLANAAFLVANTPTHVANSASSYANASFTKSNSAFLQANTPSHVANSASSYANAAFIYANAAYNLANTGGSATDQYARDTANSAGLYANAAFIAANTADGKAVTAGSYANSAYAQANTATNNAAGASSYANVAFVKANAAFDKANTGVANTATTANVAINARITIVNTGIYYPIVTDTTITGSDTFHYSSSDFLMYAANNSFRAAGNVWAGENIVVGNNVPVVNSTGHWVGQAILSSAPTSYINNGTSNLYFSTTNGNIIANVGGNTIATVTNVGIVLSEKDLNGANNIYANNFIANSSFKIIGATSGNLSGANNIYANNIVANVGAIIAGTNVIPYIQNVFDQSNSAFLRANTPSHVANSAALYANAAFAKANTGVANTAETANVAINARITIVNTGIYYPIVTDTTITGSDTFHYSSSDFLMYAANNSFRAAGNVWAGENIVVGNNVPVVNSTGYWIGQALSATDLVARAQANSAFLQANTPSHVANSASSYANASFTQANSAFLQANTPSHVANSASSYANASFIQSNSAFLAANTPSHVANSAASYANAAFNQANAAFAVANTGGGATTDQYARDTANSAFSAANTANNNASGASLYANAAFIKANTGVAESANTANTANVALLANVAVYAKITNVAVGTYYPIVTDTTVTGSDTFHYSSNDILIYAANNTFRVAGNVWAGQFIAVGNNVPVVNSTGHWVGQAIVSNTATSANIAATANVAINARITIVNTGIYFPIVTDTTITGSDTLHYSSSDFLMYAANNTFRAAGNVWAGENIAVGSNIPVVNSTGHWIGQTVSGVDSFARNAANSAGSYANAAFLKSNSAFLQTNAAFIQANAAFISVNSAFSLSNGTAISANTPSHVANTAGVYANGAFTQANSGFDSANSASSYANAAFNQANTDFTNIILGAPGEYGNSTYVPVITVTANGRINSVSAIAITAGGGGGGGGDATYAFIQANAAFSKANAAFNAANTTTSNNDTTLSGIITPLANTSDQFNIIGITGNINIYDPAGTPTEGQKLIIRIKDAGTSVNLSWNVIYRSIGVSLPTNTVANKTAYIGLVYNTADSKWDVVAASLQG